MWVPSWGKGPVLSRPCHVREHAGSVWQEDERKWLVLVACSVAIWGRYRTGFVFLPSLIFLYTDMHISFKIPQLISLWCITLYLISTGKNSSKQYENAKALRNVTKWRPFSTGHILQFVLKTYQGNKKRRCLTKCSKAEHTYEDAFKRTT